MDKYVYGIYSNEDQLDNHDRLYNKFLDIFVLNPRTHIKKTRALFTDYEVHVKTNHPEFAIKDSQVRRRYSEFAWLKARLGMNDIMMTTAPSLPGKKYVGRFKDPFLLKRQLGLQHFMNKVVEVNPFLSDPALHLFLQTELSISQMESYLKHGVMLSNIRDRVIAEQRLREQKQKTLNEVDLEPPCFEHECLLSRSLSLDSLLSIRKDEKTNEKTSGRGWSNFIGESSCRNEVYYADKDVTDFQRHAPVDSFRSESKKTACVLPGGQLQLADELSESTDTTPKKPCARPASWHGKTFDMIDLLLDSYDVIDVDKSSNLDSFSVSQYSAGNSSGTIEHDSYSDDDGIEIDIDSRLNEYSIISPITSPARKLSKEDYTEFHHSYSSESTEEQFSGICNNPSAIRSPEPGARKPTQSNTESTYASLDAEGFHHSDSFSS